jgi:hypothetical protein
MGVAIDDLLIRRPRVQREPDARQLELFHDADGGKITQQKGFVAWWAEAAGLRAELGARREWGLRRRLRWALGRRR